MLKTGECFTLRGHSDWVNAVQLWDSNAHTGCSSTPTPTLDMASDASQPNAGKMLFSASDDGTIRLWDLALRSCVRIFKGHVGQVQSLKLLTLDEESDDEDDEVKERKRREEEERQREIERARAIQASSLDVGGPMKIRTGYVPKREYFPAASIGNPSLIDPFL